jgi:hypothetical protein
MIEVLDGLLVSCIHFLFTTIVHSFSAVARLLTAEHDIFIPFVKHGLYSMDSSK